MTDLAVSGLLVLPFLALASLTFLSPRSLALALSAGCLALMIPIILFVPVDTDLFGLRVHADNLARVFSCLAVVSALAVLGLARVSDEARIGRLVLPPLAFGVLALTLRQDFAVAALLAELALLSFAPVLQDKTVSSPRTLHRYLTVGAVGVCSLLLVAALIDQYRVDRDPYLTRLILAFLLVGWGLILGAFPFHFWLAALSAASPLGAFSLFVVLRPLMIAVLLGTLAALPWLYSDSRSIAILAFTGMLGALICAALSLTRGHTSNRTAYILTANLGFVIAAASAGSSLGFFGAALVTVIDTIAILVLTGSVMLLDGQPTSPLRFLSENRAQLIGRISLGIAVLALAGAPFTGGFTGRWMIYQAVWNRWGAWTLAFLIAASLLTLISGLSLSAASPSTSSGPWTQQKSKASYCALLLLVAFGALLILAVGVYPAPLVHLANGFDAFDAW